MYRFDLQPQFLSDYEVSNWYVSTHPKSHFVHDLVAAMAGPEVRYSLRNDEWTTRHRDGRFERKQLSSVEEVRAVLREPFGITLPDTVEVDQVLGSVIARAQEASAAT